MTIKIQGHAPIFRQRAIALGRAFILGTGASLLCWGSSATAVETVILQHGNQEQRVSIQTLRDYVNSGTAPAELSDFLGNLGNLSELLPEVLGREIRVGQDFIRSTLETSIGEFILIQLDQAMNTGSPEANIDALRRSIESAVLDDGALSLLELIERYPGDTLRVNLNGLQLAYVRVSNFIERVEPALRVAKDFLQDLICDCDPGTAPAATEVQPEAEAEATEGDPQATLPAGGRAACQQAALLDWLTHLETVEAAAAHQH